MDSYFFHQDKNYILKEIQSSLKPVFLEKWVLQAIDSYLQINNPLGLIDDFILSIVNTTTYETSFLDKTYDYLAATYRYYHSSNQLEFLWDGQSQQERYQSQWTEKFEDWCKLLGNIDAVNRSMIRACVLKTDTSNELLEKNFSRIVLQQFRLKWDGRRNSLIKAA